MSASLLRRFAGSVPRAALVAALWLAAIHGLAIGAVVDSRRRDAAEYAANRPFFELLERLGPSERLGVRAKELASPAFRRGLLVLFGSLTGAPDAPAGIPTLRPEIEALFVPIRATQAGQEQRLLVPALKAEVVVLGADPRR